MMAESWDGFKWFIEKDSDKEVLSKGEISVLRALYSISGALGSEVFVDVGAYKGYYTVRMAKRCRQVIAFEPNPENRRILEENVRLNGLNNVTIYPYAVGEARYRAKLYPRASGSTLLEGYVNAKPVEVEVIPLDEIVDRADIVKIDVEGYEAKVIEGAKGLIEQLKPTLVIEHHDFRHYKIRSYEEISSYLRELGYIELYLTEPHRLYYHRSRPLEVIRPLIADHYVNMCIMNITRGLPWYHGLPYTWWWGMNLIDFMHEIKEHVLRPDEPEWVENLLKRKAVNKP
jgi:FkbM family methyltransferase